MFSFSELHWCVNIIPTKDNSSGCPSQIYSPCANGLWCNGILSVTFIRQRMHALTSREIFQLQVMKMQAAKMKSEPPHGLQNVLYCQLNPDASMFSSVFCEMSAWWIIYPWIFQSCVSTTRMPCEWTIPRWAVVAAAMVELIEKLYSPKTKPTCKRRP